MSQTLLTGIKPTGTPHLGNYAGAIRPTCALAQSPDVRSLLLIADAHALNLVRDPAQLREHVREVAATYAAFGLSSERCILFRQSDVPEIFQLSSILASYCGKGMANRAHAYKAAAARNVEAGKAEDAGINMGLFTYPILMSADILAFDTDIVPVGADQRQHVELTIALAQSVNHIAGSAVRVPGLRIDPSTHTLPGTDGRKMSKSYNNTIPLFCTSAELKKRVGRFRTDSRAAGEPADADACGLFSVYSVFASAEEKLAMRAEYSAGIGYGDVKAQVAMVIEQALAEPRERYEALMADRGALDDMLEEGAERARSVAGPVLKRIRGAVGLA